MHSKFQVEDPIWRAAATQSARQFMLRHNLLDGRHRRALAMLRQGAPVVRVSHQPNLFAGLNIVGLLVIAEALAQRYEGVVVFVAVDYDAAGDQRFRSALLPPVVGDRPVYLKGAVTKADHQKVAFAMPTPSYDTVKSWTSLHAQAAVRYRSAKSGSAILKLGLPPELLQRSASLTDFNLAVIAHLSSRLLSRPPLFVTASDYLAPLGKQVNSLVSTVLQYRPALTSHLVWRICNNCLRRCHGGLKVRSAAITCTWQCHVCNYICTEELDWGHRLPRSGGPAFVPQVLLCDMIDAMLIRAAESVSYAGSLPHLVASQELYREISGSLTQPQDYVWRPADLGFSSNYSLPELWDRGRFSAYLYEDIFGSDVVRENILRSASTCLRVL